VHPHALPQRVLNPRIERLRVIGRGGAEVGPVVAGRRDLATGDVLEGVAALQAGNPLVQGFRLRGVLQGEVVRQARRVHLRILGQRHQRLLLAGEVRAVLVDQVVERLDPVRVAGPERLALQRSQITKANMPRSFLTASAPQ
jgi:hypothetical protein